MSDYTVPTREELAKQYGPTTDEEAMASARAVIEHRENEDARAELEQLTDFEAELAGRAYQLGRTEILNILDTALGRAAATADVAALRRELADSPGGLRMDVQRIGPHRAFIDERAAKLVWTARRYVERLAEARREQ